MRRGWLWVLALAVALGGVAQEEEPDLPTSFTAPLTLEPGAEEPVPDEPAGPAPEPETTPEQPASPEPLPEEPEPEPAPKPPPAPEQPVPSPEEEPVPAEATDLDQEAARFFGTLLEVHPDPYHTLSQTELESLQAEVEAKLANNLDLVGSYKLLAPAAAAIGDGETQILPPRADFLAFSQNGGLVFPLVLDLSGQLPVVTDDLGSGIPVGSQILNIAGQPVWRSLSQPLSWISGAWEPGRRARLQQDFPLYWWLAHGPTAELELLVETPSGERQSLTLPGITYDQWPQTAAEPVSWKVFSEGVAHLVVRDFTGDSARFLFTLNGLFAEMERRSADRLIVDLRSASGGDPNLARMLLYFLTAEPFRMYAQVDTKVSDPVRSLHPGDPNVAQAENGAILTAELAEETPPPGPRFSGELYVLTGPATAGPAASVAAVVKDYKLGTLVGEETGGLATRYGGIYRFSLGDSGLEAEVPHQRFVRPAGFDDGRGVLPDLEIPVRQALDDLLERLGVNQAGITQ